MSDTLISKQNLEAAVKRIASEMESAVSNVEIDLYDGVDSTATNIAATANAVKQAYDLAASASSTAAGAGDGPYYCTCSTAAATTAKEATCDVDFTVANGVSINVYFTYANTATSGVTLKVSTPTGTAVAYNIAEAASGSTCSPWNTGDVVQLTYIDSTWVQVLKDANATTYGLARMGAQSINTSGTATITTTGYLDNSVLNDIKSVYALKKIYADTYTSLGRSGTVGTNSYAYGHDVIAAGSCAHAEGDGTFAYADQSHAEGHSTQAGGSSSDTTIGIASHAEGNSTLAAADYSHAEGDSNNVYNYASHVEGYGNTLGVSDAITTDTTTVGHVEGYGNILTGSYGCHGEGVSNTSDSDYTHIEGNQNTITTSENCHVEGYKNTITSGTTNHVEGVGHNVTSGIYSHAEGGYVSGSTTYGNVLGGTCSHVEGARNTIIANYVHVEGYRNTGATNYSHVEGQQNTSYAAASHAEGYLNYAYSKASYCHIEGQSNKVYGAATHIEGNSNTATFPYVHIEGFSNVIGDASNYENEHENTDNTGVHLEGYQNTVNYTTGNVTYGTHVEGYQNSCTGATGCHIEGSNNSVLNVSPYAHVGGYQSVVNNSTGFAHGYYVQSYTCCETTIGQYNTISTDAGSTSTTTGNAFVIGNGSSETSRNNAFRVTKTGIPYAQGALNTSGADYAEFVKEWIDGNKNNEDRVGYFVTLKDDKLCFANDGDYIIGVTSGAPSVVGSSDIEYKGKFLYDEFGRIIIEDDKFKLNPEYDSSQTYIQRIDRPEWDYVGMLGVIYVRDDGTCEQYGYCKCGSNGIATAAIERGFDTYFVVERTRDNIIRIMLK